MSSAKALSDKQKSVVGSFFAFNLRFYWQNFVLCLIVTLLGMVLPSVINIDRYSGYHQLTERMVQSLVSDVSAIGILISIVAGVYFGMTAMAYVNSKRQVGCYHSFPLKRESIFITESVSRTVYYLISILLGYGLSYLILAASLPFVGQFAGAYFENLAVAILVYLYVYHLFLLAGSLTGTDVMKFMMAFVIAFLPIVLHALVCVSAGMGNDDLHVDYYMGYSVQRWLCTPLRIVEYLDNRSEGLFPRMLNVFTEIVLYYVAAMGLYKFRKSELSGTTIVWKPVFAIVKYALIFVASVGGGYMFDGIFSGGTQELRILFGNLFGFVVAFMLTNAILFRSARAMFRDLKQAGIFAAVILLFNVIVPFNVFGMVGKPYEASFTDRIELEIDNINVIYENRESVAYLTDTLLKEEGQDKALPLYDGKVVYYRNYSYYTDSIQTVQYPKVGVPLALDRRVSYNSDLWSWLMASDEYRQARAAVEPVTISDVESMKIQLGDTYFYVNAEYADYTYLNYENEADRVVTNFFTEIPNDFGYYQQVDISDTRLLSEILSLAQKGETVNGTAPVIGNLRVYHHTSGRVNYPIYAEDLALINAINAFRDDVTMRSGLIYEESDLFGAFESVEDIYRSCYDEMNLLVMVDEMTGEIRKMDRDTFLSLAGKTAVLCGDRANTFFSFVRESDVPYSLIFVEGEGTEEEALGMILDYVGAAELNQKYSGEQIAVAVKETYSSYLAAYAVRFRHDAITAEEAAAVFASLEKLP